MSVTEMPYLESFRCRFDTGEGCEHDGYCDWGWACGTCARWLSDGPCPDHAPLDVPGLELAECTSESRHPRTWFPATDSGYPPPCMYCCHNNLSKAHEGCEHSHHRRWRRSWLVAKLVRYGYSLGIVAGSMYAWDAHCRGCLTHIRFGRNSYLLGRENEWWVCLLRHHHLRQPDPSCPALCNVCTPPDKGGAA